mmetsp:Transcript_1388/g.3083  ORF Transcript_1388/g.3083 Transcript_1388/m.3083 type:complete len:213 (+) Transcript_1388:69-707(+)
MPARNGQPTCNVVRSPAHGRAACLSRHIVRLRPTCGLSCMQAQTRDCRLSQMRAEGDTILDHLGEVGASSPKVYGCGRRGDRKVRHHHHDIAVREERLDSGSEFIILHLEVAEIGLRLLAAELKLLDDVGQLLEAVAVLDGLGQRMRDNEEGVLLENHDLVSLQNLTHEVQVILQDLRIWNEHCHNLCPGFEKRVIPDRRRQACQVSVRGQV